MPSGRTFRPCLCHFFAKGTVAYDPRPQFSTVPLPGFCKRHGRARRLPHNFDRAFDVFLRKARSRTPSASQFRPCLCHFFAKGTVAQPIWAHFLTVPLTFFCKRHGRARRLPHNFDRAFAAFLQKARSRKPYRLQFRPCLCPFFAKGTVAQTLQAPISIVPLPGFCKRHGRTIRLDSLSDRAFASFL